MKKILLVVMTIVLCFSSVACGLKETVSGDNNFKVGTKFKIADFEVKLTKWETSKKLKYDADSNKSYVVLYLTVKNTSSEAKTFDYKTGGKDHIQSEIGYEKNGHTYNATKLTNAMEDVKELDTSQIPAGETVKGVLVFSVPDEILENKSAVYEIKYNDVLVKIPLK